MAMRISPGCGPASRKLALALTTLAAMAGLGYAFWCLLYVVQSWAASTTWAAQVIQ
jgi:hypothetical protein